MSERPCSEWWPFGCVLSANIEQKSEWCKHLDTCMYAIEREDMHPDLLELWDAWCNNRVCMLWYRPAAA